MARILRFTMNNLWPMVRRCKTARGERPGGSISSCAAQDGIILPVGGGAVNEHASRATYLMYIVRHRLLFSSRRRAGERSPSKWTGGGKRREEKDRRRKKRKKRSYVVYRVNSPWGGG